MGLRAHVATLLRTESRLYKAQATLDRQVRLLEKLNELGVRLLGARAPSEIARSVSAFVTLDLRYERALVLFRSGDGTTFEPLGWDGFERQFVANVRTLRLENRHPLLIQTAGGRRLQWPSMADADLAAFARAIGVATFTAHGLAGVGGAKGVLVAGSTLPEAAENRDEVSSRGLASLAAQSGALLSAMVSNLAVDAERALLERRVAERTHELSVALEEVTRLSRVDPLTGLLNRRAFRDRAEHAIALARRYRRSCAIAMVDVDHFKNVNDVCGHQVGDAVLVAIGKALTGVVRDCDCVGRYGGEEFAVLLGEITTAAVSVVGERLRLAVTGVDSGGLTGGKTKPITASFGLAIYPDHGDQLETLLARADEALYFGKRSGRNAVITYDERCVPEP